MFYKIILFTFMVTISESFIFHQRHMKVHVSITNNLQLPTHIIKSFLFYNLQQLKRPLGCKMIFIPSHMLDLQRLINQDSFKSLRSFKICSDLQTVNKWGTMFKTFVKKIFNFNTIVH